MDKKEQELAKVKALIRSILISAPTGRTVQELQIDFLSFTGEAVPYAKYGFYNARNFLESLHDVLQFFNSNGQEKVTQVSHESTAHIEKLVASQTLKKKKAIKYRPGGKFTNLPPVEKIKKNKWSPPRFAASKFKFTSTPGRQSDQAKVEESYQYQPLQCEENWDDELYACGGKITTVQPKYYSEKDKDVQNKVKQVMKTAPQGLWAKRLSVLYKKMFKQELPLCELGYKTVVDYVISIPHILDAKQPYDGGDWFFTLKPEGTEEGIAANTPPTIEEWWGEEEQPLKRYRPLETDECWG